jgi:hypothetical protein
MTGDECDCKACKDDSSAKSIYDQGGHDWVPKPSDDPSAEAAFDKQAYMEDAWPPSAWDGPALKVEIENAIRLAFVRVMPDRSSEQDRVAQSVLCRIWPLIDTLTRERDDLQEEARRFEDRLAMAEDRANEFEAQLEALHEKLDALAPHGTCACAYDRPDDVCNHHSPKLVAAEARCRELEAERDGVERQSQKNIADMIGTRNRAIRAEARVRELEGAEHECRDWKARAEYAMTRVRKLEAENTRLALRAGNDRLDLLKELERKTEALKSIIEGGLTGLTYEMAQDALSPPASP